MSRRRSSRQEWQEMLPRRRPFLKMQGLGNHFIIVDAREEGWRAEPAEIARLCDPRCGVGADQVVVVEPPSPGGAEDGAQAFVRFWNVDGREAQACGNATRCVAWLLLEEASLDELRLETRVGVIECRRAGKLRVTTGMGRISMAWQDIPLSRQQDTCHLDVQAGPLVDAVALNIGNPHVVFFVDDVDAIDLRSLAPGIQNDPLFPEQVNVGVAQLEAHDRIRLRVYERGAGLTAACGSGACVAAFAALARGLTDARKMTVRQDGGELAIEILPDGSAVMTGPVAFCFSGYLPFGETRHPS